MPVLEEVFKNLPPKEVFSVQASLSSIQGFDYANVHCE